MSFRVQILVNHASGAGRYAGWSNTFYHTSDTVAAALPAVMLLASAINECMGKHSVPIAARFNKLDPAGNAIVIGKRFMGLERLDYGTLGSQSGDDSATPEKCLVMRDLAGDDARTWFMNGIPDNRETQGGDFTPTGAYQTRLNRLFAVLSLNLNGFKIRVQDRTVAKIRVNGITVPGVVTTTAAHGFADGSVVHCIGGRGEDVFNGRYKIDVLSATTFKLRASAYKAFVITEGANPEVYAEKMVLRDYAGPQGSTYAVKVVRSGSHPVGRPFDLHTGRRTR